MAVDWTKPKQSAVGNQLILMQGIEVRELIFKERSLALAKWDGNPFKIPSLARAGAGSGMWMG